MSEIWESMFKSDWLESAALVGWDLKKKSGEKYLAVLPLDWTGEHEEERLNIRSYLRKPYKYDTSKREVTFPDLNITLNIHAAEVIGKFSCADPDRLFENVGGQRRTYILHATGEHPKSVSVREKRGYFKRNEITSPEQPWGIGMWFVYRIDVYARAGPRLPDKTLLWDIEDYDQVDRQHRMLT